MTKPSAKRMKWSAVRAVRKAEHDQIYRIHEAERRVIEAAKAWGCSANSAHPTLNASRKLLEAVLALQEAERD